MPTVPKYDLGQVQQSRPAGPDASAASFGAGNATILKGAANAGENIGQGLLGEAANEQDQINQARLADGARIAREQAAAQAQAAELADRAQVRDTLSQYSNALLDYNSQNVLTKKGAEAINLLPTAQADYTKIRNKFGDSLQSPKQKEMFAALSYEPYDSASAVTRNHQTDQQLEYSKQTLVASKATAVDTAMQDHSRAPAAEETIIADNNALFSGAPKEQMDLANRTEISKLHADIASQLALSDPARASTYLNSYKDKILPEDFDKLKNTFQTQIISDGANKAVSTLGDFPLDAALKEANKIEDPQTRQLTIEGLKSNQLKKDDTKALADADSNANIALLVTTDPASAALRLPSSTPLAQRQWAVSAANNRLAAQQNGTPIQTDQNVYGNLMSQARNDPDGFLRRDLARGINSLSDADAKSVLEVRDGLAKRRPEAKDKAFQLDTVHSTFTTATSGVKELTTLDDSGKELPPGPLRQQRNAEINSFKQQFMQTFLNQYPDVKDQTPENAYKVIDNLISRRVTEKGWFSDTSQPLGLIQANPTLDRANFGKTMTPRTVDGKQVFFDYNSDLTAADVYDQNGVKIGTWPPKQK